MEIPLIELPFIKKNSKKKHDYGGHPGIHHIPASRYTSTHRG